jgi:hypothetical protein
MGKLRERMIVDLHLSEEGLWDDPVIPQMGLCL